MAEAFFVPDGDRFVASDWTRGPWDPKAQHAGPPAALVARAIERLAPPELRMARFTFEVLRPVPVGPVAADARAVRSGRRVQFAEGSLSDDDGQIARAAAWRILPAEPVLAEANLEPPPFPGPGQSPPLEVVEPWEGPSYFTGMEWRLARGTVSQPGPAAVWMRMRIPLVDGEEPSPLTRVLTAADSGNGVSAELPMEKFLSINTELTVHLVRMPEGPWIGLDAVTRIAPDGVGLAQSVLWDARGRIGAGGQSLLVAPR